MLVEHLKYQLFLKDETNEITVKILEFAGSPMREYIEMWLTGVSDPNSGFTHYHGLAIPQTDSMVDSKS